MAHIGKEDEQSGKEVAKHGEEAKRYEHAVGAHAGVDGHLEF